MLSVPALMCIVKPDGPPQLCKTDEIGEIVINSRAGGTMYYGLPGVTKNTFEVFQSSIFIFAYKLVASVFYSKTSSMSVFSFLIKEQITAGCLS